MAERLAVVSRIRRIPLVAGAVAMALGVGLLQAYVAGAVPLMPMALFLPPAQPLDGVLFALTGAGLIAFCIRAVRLRRVSAGVAGIIATALILEYLLRIDLGLDDLLFPDQVAQLARIFPGRPAPLSCVAFLLLATLLVVRPTIGRRRRRWYGALLLVSVTIPTLAVAGHLGDVPELYGLVPGSGVALYAALALLLLSAGVAAVTHEREVTDLLVSQDAGTALLRRLLPLALILPILFTVGGAQALRLSFYQVHIGLVAYVTLFIGVSMWAAFRSAEAARRLETERRAAERAQAELSLRNRLLEAQATAQAALQESEEHTRELLDILSHTPVAARGLDRRIRFWSTGAERLYGWTSEEMMQAGARDLLATEMPVHMREAEA